MYWADFYERRFGVKNPEEAFDYLLRTFKKTNRSHDYFVNWSNVQAKVKEMEIELHLLDALIGKEKIFEEAIHLFTQYPKTMKTAPILIAQRETSIDILELYDRTRYIEESLSFSEESKPEDVANFLEKVGLMDLLKGKHISSVIDYVTGVEVGLDTNGRKNRSGKNMENIIWYLLDEMCTANNWQVMQSATKGRLKREWGFEIHSRKANKKIDFAINANGVLILIETNFYSSSGSKLKSTAKEYETVSSSYGHPFVWITDGVGWHGDNSLKDAFETIDHIININMVQSNLLQDIILEHIKRHNNKLLTTPELTTSQN